MLHHTHKLAVYRRMFFCLACGHYAQIRPIKLVCPCLRVNKSPTHAGLNNTRRIAKDLHPQHPLGRWPTVAEVQQVTLYAVQAIQERAEIAREQTAMTLEDLSSRRAYGCCVQPLALGA